MIDLQRWRHTESPDPHEQCKRRETEAWRKAIDELERRQKIEHRWNGWKAAAICAWIYIVAYNVRWWMGW